MLLFYLCCKSYQYNFDFYNIFGTMMLLFCAKNIEIRKIVKLDLYIRIVRCILFFTLPFMGLMINEINIWIGGRTRTFFGWTHPNMMGLDFLLLAMDIMYLRKEKKKWYDIILYIGFILLLEKTQIAERQSNYFNVNYHTSFINYGKRCYFPQINGIIYIWSISPVSWNTFDWLLFIPPPS